MCDSVDINILGKKMFFQTAIVGEKNKKFIFKFTENSVLYTEIFSNWLFISYHFYFFLIAKY